MDSAASVHTTPSRRSIIENRQSLSEKAEEAAIGKEEERGLIRRVPMFRRPVEDHEKWHDKVDIPSQWTPFFYGTFQRNPQGETRGVPLITCCADLVVVAVLTVFGLTHDLSDPSAIPVFLG